MKKTYELVKEEAEKIFFCYHNLFQKIGGDLGEEVMVSRMSKNCALICALIAVDCVLDVARGSDDIDHINFWEAVRKEIEKLKF
jgi:hypothetical protein